MPTGRGLRHAIVPVVTLTGPLGAGKTTLLNGLLARPGTRAGVVINDFGALEVDAALITGQVGRAASIAGGCICCLPDAGGLDAALTQLAQPRLRLDVIVIEASGAADPLNVARLLRGVRARVRPAGLIDVVDAVATHRAIASGSFATARFIAASLVAVTKLDRLVDADAQAVLDAVRTAVGESAPRAAVLPVGPGGLDPALVFDLEAPPESQPPLPLAEMPGHGTQEGAHHGHERVKSVSASASGPVDATALAAFLEAPPAGVYRVKGVVTVRENGRGCRWRVDLVGGAIDVVPAPRSARDLPDGLVALGADLDATDTRERLEAALAPAASGGSARPLLRHRRRPG